MADLPDPDPALDLVIDTSSSVPPFDQLRSGVAARVVRGELAPGARLPTVRGLAAQLGLAVNTVARAYRELESDGVISTEGRRGTFVTSARLASPAEDVSMATAAFVRSARRSGLTLPEATRLVERAWLERPEVLHRSGSAGLGHDRDSS